MAPSHTSTQSEEGNQCRYQGLSPDNSGTTEGWGQFPLIHLQHFGGGGGVLKRLNTMKVHIIMWVELKGRHYHTQSQCSWGETVLISFKVERDLTLSPWSEKCTP